MYDPEAYRDFLRQERYDPTGPLCWHCGSDCSGDTTETVLIDGTPCEVPVCDPDEHDNPGCGD